MKLLVVLFVMILLIGCSQHQTIVRQDTLTVKPPIVIGAGSVNPDSVLNWNYIEVIKNDTIVMIQYIDREKKVYYKVKPDSVVVVIQDTVQIAVTETLYKPTFWQKLSFGSIGAITGILLIGGLFLARKMSWI
jgi:hypothetical protein